MTEGAPAPDAALSPQAFAARMAILRHAGPLAVAVSGGGDSMALMALTAEWAAERDIPLLVLTVDHGLRAGSAEDAAFVQKQAETLGLRAQRLEWSDEKPVAGIQAKAREARYRLMADACLAEGVETLALAHTLEDQAETVLMRLARGSGVDGLSAMSPVTELYGLRLIRPLLDSPRAALRAVLAMRGLTWRDDPSNNNEVFERVRARKALSELAPLGVDAHGLARVAARMGEARAALDAAAANLARRAAAFEPIGYVRIDPAAMAAAPRETALRLLSASMRWTSGAIYPPGRDELERALDWLSAAPVEGGRTLHGCQLDAGTRGVTLSREPAAATDVIGPADGLWDGRFRCTPVVSEGAEGATIRALGAEGAKAVKTRGDAPDDWRRAPRAARLSAPALWWGERLLSVPFAKYALAPGAQALQAVAAPAPFSLKGRGEGLC